MDRISGTALTREFSDVAEGPLQLPIMRVRGPLDAVVALVMLSPKRESVLSPACSARDWVPITASIDAPLLAAVHLV